MNKKEMPELLESILGYVKNMDEQKKQLKEVWRWQQEAECNLRQRVRSNATLLSIAIAVVISFYVEIALGMFFQMPLKIAFILNRIRENGWLEILNHNMTIQFIMGYLVLFIPLCALFAWGIYGIAFKSMCSREMKSLNIQERTVQNRIGELVKLYQQDREFVQDSLDGVVDSRYWNYKDITTLLYLLNDKKDLSMNNVVLILEDMKSE